MIVFTLKDAVGLSVLVALMVVCIAIAAHDLVNRGDGGGIDE